MSAVLRIERVSPLTSVQDAGRHLMLAHGVTPSGPMDRSGFAAAAFMLGGAGGAGLEFTAGGIAVVLASGRCRVGFAGGAFRAARNDVPLDWPGSVELWAGDRLAIETGPAGNYGYLRFSGEIELPPVLGSRATNMRVGLGGLDGRALVPGDTLAISEAPMGAPDPGAPPPAEAGGPIRVLWGLHAGLFPPAVQRAFLETEFIVTAGMDRMGVRLEDPGRVFASVSGLSLVSDAVVAGDIQILGDGTPVVLMRDHQPTGGYSRIATIISADLDRFAQLRPGARIRFESVGLARAQALAGSRPS